MEDKLTTSQTKAEIKQVILQHNAELRHGFNELANGKTANEQTIAAILALIQAAEVAARIDEINHMKRICKYLFLSENDKNEFGYFCQMRKIVLTKQAEVSL